MRFQFVSLGASLLSLISLACAKTWSFQDGSVSIQSKGSGVGGAKTEKFSADKPISQVLSLGASDTLKLSITTTDDKKAKRAHQAFLTFQDPNSGLEDAYVINVKDSGKGKLELTQKDIPVQFLTINEALKASVIIGGFGASTPLQKEVFSLSIVRDPAAPLPTSSEQVRYGKQPEIHHLFKADPKSPPKIITLAFTAACLATLPALFGVWMYLGANVDHLGEALSNAPLAHAGFFGSILGLEGIFFMYYKNWTLFQMLPAAGAVGTVAFLSGSRALSEVQGRRLAGKR